MAHRTVKPIGAFERNLTWWVFGCIVAGIALGQALPGFSERVGGLKVAEVNVPVAVLVWLMIIPMLLKIDFAQMGGSRSTLAASA